MSSVNNKVDMLHYASPKKSVSKKQNEKVIKADLKVGFIYILPPLPEIANFSLKYFLLSKVYTD